MTFIDSVSYKTLPLFGANAVDFDRADFDPTDLLHATLALTSTGQLNPALSIKNIDSATFEMHSLLLSLDTERADAHTDVPQASTQEHISRSILPSESARQDTLQLADTAREAAPGLLAGEKLTALKGHRDSAKDLQKLLVFYQEFKQSGVSKQLDMLAKSDAAAELEKAATHIQSLLAASRIKDAPATPILSDVQKYAEDFEQRILDQFASLIRVQEYERASSCARILIALNDGYSCIQTFISQNDFFNTFVIEPGEIYSKYYTSVKESIDVLSMDSLDPMIDSLFKSIILRCHKEWKVISMVFGDQNSARVMDLFIEKIFVLIVKLYIETCLDQASRHSDLAYLQSLYVSHKATHTLAADLYSIYKVKNRDTRHKLQGYAEALFLPFLEGDDYAKKEIDTLQKLYKYLLYDFYSKQNQKSTPSGLFSMTKKLATKATTETKEIHLYLIDGDPWVFSFTESNEADLQLQVEIACRALSMLACTLIRTKELSPQHVERAMEDIFMLYFDEIGKNYIESVIENVLEERMAMYTNTSIHPATDAPDMTCFDMAHRAEQSFQLIQIFIQKYLGIFVDPESQLYRTIIDKKCDFFASIEVKVNVVVVKELEYMLSWIASKLSCQDARDYQPTDDSLLAQSSTNSCTEICDFISKLIHAMQKCLSEPVQRAFSHEFGLCLFSALLDRLSRLTISEAGSILLIKDLAKYREATKGLKDTKVCHYFDVLKELGNLFLVKSQNILDIIKESPLCKLGVKTLIGYIKSREDHSAELEQLLLSATL